MRCTLGLLNLGSSASNLSFDKPFAYEGFSRHAILPSNILYTYSDTINFTYACCDIPGLFLLRSIYTLLLVLA